MKRVIVRLALALSLLCTPALYAADSWNYRIGEEAPAFKLKSLAGKTVSSLDLKGQFAVVSFMTSWCPFCNASVPALEKLSQTYATRGVHVLVVDVAEERGPIKKFVAEHSLTFPVLLDNDGVVTTSYAPPPTLAPDLDRQDVMIASFLIVDPSGKIQFLSLNEDTAKFDAKLTRLQARLDELLAAR